MRKLLGIILLVIVTAFIVYVALFYEAEGDGYINKQRVYRSEELRFTNYSDGIRKISMKQIDSLSAAMNLDFTIRNAVYHAVKLDEGRKK